MALIPCPECRRQVSDRARSCPGCGYPLDGSAPRQVTPIARPAPAEGIWLAGNTSGFADTAPTSSSNAGMVAAVWIVGLLGLALFAWQLSPIGAVAQELRLPWTTGAPPIDAPAAVRPTPTALWDRSDYDITRNGNVQIAVGVIKSGGLSKSDIAPLAGGDLTVAPFSYIGKVAAFQGNVELVQQYPPTSQVSQQLAPGATLSEIVLIDHRVSDTVPIDFLVLGGSSSVQTGDTVAVFGFLAGLDRVTTSAGGQTTQLVVVGDQVQRVTP
jgi:hypothetical protein